MKKIVVAASSLPAGRNMSSQIEYIQRVGTYGADMYHLDVMDGEFTRYKTIDYTYIEQLRERSPLIFDAHLMVKNVEKSIKQYIKAGADIITVHYEVFLDAESLIKVLKKIKRAGKMAGLAVDIDTDVKVVDQFLKYLDMVTILCVKVGKGGQQFNETSLKKIKYVRSLNHDILIEADGGINPTTGAQCVRAGADVLVSGAYIYNNDTYEAIQQLKGKTN